jgi:hypothetical protein
MSATGAIESGVIGIFLAAVVFIWDGLVRRHIRLTYDLAGWQVNIRRVPAVLLGGLGAVVGIIDGQVIIQQLSLMAGRCRGTFPCMAQQALSPLISSWQVVVAMILELGVFAIWLMGAFELHGPYRRRLIAPGVWFNEKDLVDAVARDLREARMPSVDDDMVLLMGSEIRQLIGLRGLSALKNRTAVGWLEVDPTIRAVISAPRYRTSRISPEVLRVVAASIAEYYFKLYTRVPQAYHRALHPIRRGRKK